MIDAFKTTFPMDFSIADRFGKAAIVDTYRRCIKDWKDNPEYMAELVITLNHKIWEWYPHSENIAELYNDLWMKADDLCRNSFTGEDLRTYYEITD